MGLKELINPVNKANYDQHFHTDLLPDTLVFATDFSNASKLALKLALKLFGDGLKKLVLVNVYDLPSISIGSLVTVKDILSQLSKEGLDFMEDEAKLLIQDPLVEIEQVSRASNLLTVLQDCGRQNPKSVVSIGSTGISDIPDVYLGKNAVTLNKELKNIPLLMTPGTAGVKEPKNILYISDIQELDHIGNIDLLVGCAEKFDSKIHIAHISERHILQPSNITAADRDLIPIYKDLYPEVGFTYRNLNGVEPFEEQLAQLVIENEVDLVYVVLRNDGFLYDIFNEKNINNNWIFNKMPVISLRLD